MLFVSLLQGFGLLPGKAATKSGVTAAGVDAHNAADSEMAVAEKTLSRSSKTGITRKLPPVAESAKGQAVASVPASGSEKSPRRQAVKQTAEKPPKADSKASAPVKASTGKAAKAAPVKAASDAVKSKAPAVPAKSSAKPAEAHPAKADKGHAGTQAKVAPVPASKAAQSDVVAAVKPSKATPKPLAVPAQPATAVKGAGKAVATPAVKSVPAAAKKAAVPASKPEPPKVAPVVKAAVVSVAAPVAVPAPTRRGGRKSAAVSVPVPQPVPSHSPDAAKATFSNIPERVMTLPVHTPARKDPKLANNWKDKTADQLTDEEVLSMPDAEYMNDAQMAFFRHKLVSLKNGILANAGETTEHLREDTVVVPDPADRATIEEEHALELRTRDRERKLLKKIEQSIARIDSGDYGYCDETGEPIGVGRLIARPTANLSLEAQQRRELKQKMFGD
jgi:DnaK suppressor protein